MNETENENTDEDGIDTKRAYDRVVGTVEKNTVHNQPTFIAEDRLAMLLSFGGGDTDYHASKPNERSAFQTALTRGMEKRDLIRVRKNGEKWYAYVGDVEYVQTIVDTIVEWDPVPKDVVAYCYEQLQRLEDH
ncbi:hypothetical protein SAMN04487947_1246 [Halogeometricum rufum]|uniref:Uncharacterized protein n=1 Tax=Halogeometricum rufum TaxID=553469 RepID=A0A1I6GJF8_9EURY|nr:hypothetical protein [Halogeometricum rufum]SFR42279.1 hypothetical protein SAMN04487947_1246 [Halogeometricum rufum]